MASLIESSHYYHNLLLDRYRYKGTEIYRAVQNNLKKYSNFSQWIDGVVTSSNVLVFNHSFGEFALLYALVHKNIIVSVYEPDEEKSTLLFYCSEGLVPNLKIHKTIDVAEIKADKCLTFMFDIPDKSLNGISNIKVISV